MLIGYDAKVFCDEFQLAKSESSYFIFIDEIDAIGTKQFHIYVNHFSLCNVTLEVSGDRSMGWGAILTSVPAAALPNAYVFFTNTQAAVLEENEIKHKSTGRIRVMSIQNVKPDRLKPDALRSYKLSAFDQIMTPCYVPFIFFYRNNNPFAGKYTNDIHIDCNDEGVYYVETQVDCDLSSFLAKPDYNVNFFSCGGVAISMSNSHKLIDGGTYTTFLNSWASAAKGDKQNIIYPNFVSSSLFLPNTKTNSYPYFPLSFLTVKPMVMNKGKCVTKRFRFDASALQTLKAKANESVSATRVVAVTSLIWKCATSAAWKLNGERPSILQFAVNIRGEQGADKVIDEVRWLGAQMASYDADYYSTSSMCNSGMYEADFGWGTPVWTCFGYVNNDVPLYANGIMLMDTSTGDGIEAWVTLNQYEMAILEGDPDLLLYASVEPSPLQV
ncbi:transferase, chloramphenicol acetyltransferase-like domain protein, partial [Tanacetum coccineum]